MARPHASAPGLFRHVRDGRAGMPPGARCRVPCIPIPRSAHTIPAFTNETVKLGTVSPRRDPARNGFQPGWTPGPAITGRRRRCRRECRGALQARTPPALASATRRYRPCGAEVARGQDENLHDRQGVTVEAMWDASIAAMQQVATEPATIPKPGPEGGRRGAGGGTGAVGTGIRMEQLPQSRGPGSPAGPDVRCNVTRAAARMCWPQRVHHPDSGPTALVPATALRFTCLPPVEGALIFDERRELQRRSGRCAPHRAPARTIALRCGAARREPAWS
jgi:hypothetical protein